MTFKNRKLQRKFQASSSITAVVILAAIGIATTIVEPVGVPVTPFISLMVLHLMTLFLLVLPKRPAIAVIPALFSLVLSEITPFVTLVVSYNLVAIIVAVRLRPLSMDCRAAEEAYRNNPYGSLPEQLSL
jgi:hypothetical protein